jgi:hypothetical protein
MAVRVLQLGLADKRCTGTLGKEPDLQDHGDFGAAFSGFANHI